jgi:phosphopantothenoylcysteine decarboxylase/phosphopantothenate--cysteine ligase
MGYAIAEAALRRGARVLLITGPTAIAAPGCGGSDACQYGGRDAGGGFEIAAREHRGDHDGGGGGFPAESGGGAEDQAQRRDDAGTGADGGYSGGGGASRKTSQVVASQVVVGFAAETENVLENARKKLVSKSLDAIVVNDVSREGVGFDSDRNAVTIISQSEVVEVPETSKWEVAHRVLDQVVKLRKTRGDFDVVASAIPGVSARQSLLLSRGRGRPRHTVCYSYPQCLAPLILSFAARWCVAHPLLQRDGDL